MEEDQCVEILATIEQLLTTQVAVTIFVLILKFQFIIILNYQQTLKYILTSYFIILGGGGGSFHQNPRGRY